jgi:hypothetical protein
VQEEEEAGGHVHEQVVVCAWGAFIENVLQLLRMILPTSPQPALHPRPLHGTH